MLPEYQTRATEILADILRPSLREANFQTEKKVILEEIQMFEDQPPFGADEKCRAAFFGDHPWAAACWARWPASRPCRWRRCAITSSAAMPPATSSWRRPAASISIAWWPIAGGSAAAGSRPSCPRVVEPAAAAERIPSARAGLGHAAISLADVARPASDDDDRYAAKVLAIVLGDDSGSRLYWELVDPGIAEVAELSHGEYQGAGVFLTQVSCAPEDAEEVYERVMQVYEAAHAEGITEVELQQAKNKVRSQLVLSSERPAGGCSASAATGSIAASIARWKTTWSRSRRFGSIRLPTCSALFSGRGNHVDDRARVGPARSGEQGAGAGAGGRAKKA